jgi:sterol desaturase/sphingolipid hydroxylase (fatty acid hydroxylase superfamily)
VARLGPLRFVLASPAFHRWHHTSDEQGLDKNFAGLFPVWDLVFGTFYLPAEQPTAFGVRDEVPAGFLAQLAWPFRGRAPGASPATPAPCRDPA